MHEIIYPNVESNLTGFKNLSGLVVEFISCTFLNSFIHVIRCTNETLCKEEPLNENTLFIPPNSNNPHPPLYATDTDISQLLRQCERHLQANRLTTGKGGTALMCYEAVLKQDPTNAQAWAGFEDIKARYNRWTINARNRGQQNKVKRYQARLRQVATVKAKLLPPPSHLSQPTNPPILQIDTGGHKALIRDVTFTPDGRYLVSAANDKLIRVWDLETGKTVRTLRGQIGAGHEGKIFAMALSPDGRWLAAGGFMANFTGDNHEEIGTIRLYDFTSGKLITLLKGHTNVVSALAFSPDNRYLVSGSGDFNAIIWNLESKPSGLGASKPKGLDSKKLSGHTKQIYAVAFTSDSQRVVTGSYDHSLRLWRVRDGELITTMKGHTDKVQSVAISPQEDIIASGSWDHTIRLWDGRTGQFIKTLANQGTPIGSLSFSPDGRYLVSGVSSVPTNCHVWSIPDGKEIVTYRGHDNTVIATAVSPDGHVVATGGGNKQAIHLWSLRDGKLQQRLSGVGAAIWAVGFSADGRELGWGKTWKSTSPIEYTITLPAKAKALDSSAAKAKALDSNAAKAKALDSKFLGTPRKLSGSDKGFSRAQDKWRDWTLRTRKGGNYGYQAILDIRQKNRTKASIERESHEGFGHWAYTFTPDGERIISGGANGGITAYNRDGDKLGDYVGHTGTIWAVAVSSDGRLLASGSHDQTVRLWDVESRNNLLTLFHGSDGEWVAWTPTGHYIASPNGDKMVGWQINRGVDKAADYVTAAQLRDHFYRPDIIANAIRFHDVNLAITVAGGSTFSLELLNTAAVPTFLIKKPYENPYATHKQQVEIVLSFKTQPESIRAYVNGGLMDNIKNIKKWATSAQPNYHERKLTLPLTRGKNDIRIVAKNKLKLNYEQSLQVDFKSRYQEKQGTLYLIAVGVSQYQNKTRSLRFAAADARDIHKLLSQQQGKRYKTVQSRLLADGEKTLPTAANIKDALKLFKKAGKSDTVVLFLSGHGDNAKGEYYFLPYDAKEKDSGWHPDTVVKWRELQNVIENTQGKRILLVDTCYAGGAFNPRLIKDASDNEIIVISATDEISVAQELPELGHGVFTHALLKGLTGDADLMDKAEKVITIKELDTYLSFVIKEVTDGSQVPITNTTGFRDFGFVKVF
jgi:WD40 repeat protein